MNVGIKDLKTELGDDAELFDFDIITVDSKQFIRMKAKKFLPKDQFSKNYVFVQQHGGEYVSAGKASHFRIPTESTPQLPHIETSGVEPRSDKERLVREAVEMIKRHTAEVNEFLARWKEAGY